MKRIVSSIIIITMCVCSVGIQTTNTEAKSKIFRSSITPKLTSIKIKWSNKKGAVKYKIYRVKIGDIGGCTNNGMPRKKDYKKIKTVNKKRFYNDKKVKKETCYAYYVKAINKKGKVIANSYDTSSEFDYRCKGLDKPSLSNDGDGENHVNNPGEIYVAPFMGNYGYQSSKVKFILYRKVKGEKKYKKVCAKKSSVEDIKDTKAKAGKINYYKLRTYIKNGKKKYYSPYSKALKIYVVNSRAEYKVESLTKSGVYSGSKKEIVLKIMNADKYNGDTYIFRNSKYTCYNNNHGYKYCNLKVIEYSYNNKKWNKLSDYKIALPKTAPLYLKIELESLCSEDYVVYAGDNKQNYEESSIAVFDDSDPECPTRFLEYHGSGVGDTYGAIDLLAKDGFAIQSRDYM